MNFDYWIDLSIVDLLSEADAQELNALVEVRDVPNNIDWKSVYDDPELV